MRPPFVVDREKMEQNQLDKPIMVRMQEFVVLDSQVSASYSPSAEQIAQ